MILRAWLFILALALSGPAYSSASFSDEYDELIYEAWEEYIPATGDWKWLKAQYYQESLLKPNAKSPVGAMGIAQVMPGTFRDIAKKLRWDHNTNPYDPERSIEAGAFYMRYLWNQWSSKRTHIDRLRLSWASYNGGLGNILKAQKLSMMATDWKSISSKLHHVTGNHSKETLTYVRRIERWKKQLDQLDSPYHSKH